MFIQLKHFSQEAVDTGSIGTMIRSSAKYRKLFLIEKQLPDKKYVKQLVAKNIL